ncbi:MAG: response regulator transcription factor [Hahellaceae bacterium]|nr:response regulator transcription factor [Hahellaceae bacterium]
MIMFSIVEDRLPDRLRLLVVDDHPLFVEGLSLTLQGLPQKVAITAAATAEAAIRTLKVDPSFDLILLDLSLPDGRGLSLLRHVQLKRLFIPVIVISASEQTVDVDDALRAGANGFIGKGQGRQGILEAIDLVLTGEIYVPPFYTSSESLPDTNAVTPLLTSRQSEVLLLLAQGLPNKRICSELGLTEHTVKTHLKALFSLLDAHNRTECVRKAERMGLLPVV